MIVEPFKVPAHGGGEPPALWEDIQALAAFTQQWSPPPPHQFP